VLQRKLRLIGGHIKCVILGPGNGFSMAMNVVVVRVFVVIRFLIPHGSVVSQLIVTKLFTHINENIQHQATAADFSFRP